ELKRLAASGILKPTDLVWKDGMSNWARANSAHDLFSEETGIILPQVLVPASREAPEGRRDAHRGERPWRDERDDPAPSPQPLSRGGERRANEGWGYDDEDDELPRRRRRYTPEPRRRGGPKLGLILAGSALGIIVTAMIIASAIRSHERARGPFQPGAGLRNQRPRFNNPPPPIPVPQVQPPSIKGPLNVGPRGLVVQDRLDLKDHRILGPDDIMIPNFMICKVFTVNMKAGKTY